MTHAVPLVSCVMLTGKCAERYPMARIAIECFERQTWPEKELVILNHGPTRIGEGRPGVREVLHDRQAGETTGDLRNRARELASGAWCVHWDDDDWYDPRLVEVLMQSRAADACTVLRWELRIDMSCGAATYCRGPKGQYHPLYSNHAPYRYPRQDLAEDSVFMAQFPRRIVVENAPDSPVGGPGLYVRNCHGRNLWPREHILRRGRPGTLPVSAGDRELVARILGRYREEPDFSTA